MKDLFLLVDAQNDFVTGSLPVPGASLALRRIVRYLRETHQGDLFLTQDQHPRVHSRFAEAWNRPRKPGTWDPSQLSGYHGDRRVAADLDTAPVTLWPVHCVAGTWGSQAPTVLGEVVKEYEALGRTIKVIPKGLEEAYESYGILQSVTLSGQTVMTPREGTEDLPGYDRIVLAGFAMDYCVAEVLSDLIHLGLTERVSLFKDGMACIDPGSPRLSVYQEAVRGGATWI